MFFPQWGKSAIYKNNVVNDLYDYVFSGSKLDIILSINDAQRVLIIGQSKDYGVCKSKWGFLVLQFLKNDFFF